MNIIQQIAQLPPTPTPFPPAAQPPIDLPPINVWDMVPDAIQTWNSVGEVTIFFQAIVILGIIFMIWRGLKKLAQYISNENKV